MDRADLPTWTPEEMVEIVARGRPVVIDFRADWCRNCTVQEGILKRVSPQYRDRVAFGMLDVGAHPEAAESYNVMTLPTLLFFVDGVQHTSVSGLQSAGKLKRVLTEALGAEAGT